MYSKVVCFDDFRKSFKISSCKRLFGFQTSESCTATARWPADTNAELAVYCLCKRTEETIPRKLLAFVHLHFRVMFRRKEVTRIILSFKWNIFCSRFVSGKMSSSLSSEISERKIVRSGVWWQEEIKGKWYVTSDGSPRHRSDLPRQNCYEFNYSAEWWVSTQH